MRNVAVVDHRRGRVTEILVHGRERDSDVGTDVVRYSRVICGITEAGQMKRRGGLDGGRGRCGMEPGLSRVLRQLNEVRERAGVLVRAAMGGTKIRPRQEVRVRFDGLAHVRVVLLIDVVEPLARLLGRGFSTFRRRAVDGVRVPAALLRPPALRSAWAATWPAEARP